MNFLYDLHFFITNALTNILVFALKLRVHLLMYPLLLFSAWMLFFSIQLFFL